MGGQLETWTDKVTVWPTRAAWSWGWLTSNGPEWSATLTVWLQVLALPQLSSACQVRVALKLRAHSALVTVLSTVRLAPLLRAASCPPKACCPCKVHPLVCNAQYPAKAWPVTGGPYKFNPAASLLPSPSKRTVQVKLEGRLPTSGTAALKPNSSMTSAARLVAATARGPLS